MGFADKLTHVMTQNASGKYCRSELGSALPHNPSAGLSLRRALALKSLAALFVRYVKAPRALPIERLGARKANPADVRNWAR